MSSQFLKILDTVYVDNHANNSRIIEFFPAWIFGSPCKRFHI